MLTKSFFIVFLVAGHSLAFAGTTTKFTFEKDVEKWETRSKAVTVATADKPVKIGKSSLKISGTSAEGEWNFAASPAIKLVHGAKYKLSCWFWIESLSASKIYPSLGITIFDDKKYTAGFSSSPSGDWGQWKQLSVEFTAPASGSLNGEITITKNSDKISETGVFYVNDVVLEKL